MGRVWFGDGTECNLRVTLRHSWACAAGKPIAHCTTAEFAVLDLRSFLQFHSSNSHAQMRIQLH